MSSKLKFRTLSDISRDIAQVFFASVVVSPLVAGTLKQNWPLLPIGMVSSFIFWGFSLLSAQKGKL